MKFLVLLFLPFISLGQSKIDTIKILNSRVSILVPKELTTMTDTMWNLKYRQKARPIMALSDENGEVNLIANMTQQPTTENQILAYKNFQIQQLKTIHPDMDLLENGVKTINGRKFGYFKCISQAVDQKIFIYYFFTTLNGKILLFSFNCIENLKSNWEHIADNIVASIKIK